MGVNIFLQVGIFLLQLQLNSEPKSALYYLFLIIYASPQEQGHPNPVNYIL